MEKNNNQTNNKNDKEIDMNKIVINEFHSPQQKVVPISGVINNRPIRILGILADHLYIFPHIFCPALDRSAF